MTKIEQLKHDVIYRSLDNAVVMESIKEKLNSGKTLRIKLGIDPTSPNIHLGRAVPLLRLRRFQELGHQIVFIIGNFTGTIGDASDKESERPMLEQKTVDENFKTYVKQVGKIIDIDKAEIRYNADWLDKLSYREVLGQMNFFSVNDFVSRDLIKRRLEEGKRVNLREVIYPLLQGYDSVAVNADIEIGGTDQWFNLLAGRTLQKHYNQTPQDIISNVLIPGLDGRKMSSSWGNGVNLLDDPKTMFGKLMSMNDEVIMDFYTHCTLIPMEEINQIQMELDNGTNPKEIKMNLAQVITAFYHSEKEALAERENFNRVFSSNKMPENIQEYETTRTNVVEVLLDSKIVTSKSQAKRLINQKGIKVNQKSIESYEYQLKNGDILQKGKREFLKIKIK
jgi:tyrosyl-tRNA synthetase